MPGKQLTPHGDGLPGRGYIERFDPAQLGRSGERVINHNYRSRHSALSGHTDVVERTSDGRVLHHRVYDPNRFG